MIKTFNTIFLILTLLLATTSLSYASPEVERREKGASHHNQERLLRPKKE
jgi:hypothetical protein